MGIGELEKSWLGSRAGLPDNSTIPALKQAYYSGVLGKSGPLGQLETEWLQYSISDNGGTPSGNSKSDLWAQLNATLNIPVSKNLSGNKWNFYANATI